MKKLDKKRKRDILEMNFQHEPKMFENRRRKPHFDCRSGEIHQQVEPAHVRTTDDGKIHQQVNAGTRKDDWRWQNHWIPAILRHDKKVEFFRQNNTFLVGFF
jgi:hypothetical protein